jgi:hypothetical protein
MIMEEKTTGDVKLGILDVNSLYEELNKINIPLEIQHDYNGHYIDVKLVECDVGLDKIDRMITNVTQELTNYEIRRSIIEEEISNKKRNELTNNQELLKKYSTGKERETAVEMMLTNSMAEQCKLDRHILALENLLSVLKTKYSILNSKKASVKDQFRRMADQVKAGGISMAPDKDTALLMKTLQDVEKREKEFETENVDEATEYIEPDQNGGPSETDAQQSNPEPGSQSGDLVDIDIDSIQVDVPVSSPVTQKEAEVIVSVETSSDEIVIGSSNEGNKPSDSLAPAEQESVSPESEEDELEVDTILDGLDMEAETESVEPTVTETAAPSESSKESSEDLLLEDIFSNDAAVVTEEPATKKTGQGEPTPEKKSPKKASPPANEAPVKKKDDTAVKGDADVDSILDMI